MFREAQNNTHTNRDLPKLTVLLSKIKFIIWFSSYFFFFFFFPFYYLFLVFTSCCFCTHSKTVCLPLSVEHSWMFLYLSMVQIFAHFLKRKIKNGIYLKIETKFSFFLSLHLMRSSGTNTFYLNSDGICINSMRIVVSRIKFKRKK